MSRFLFNFLLTETPVHFLALALTFFGFLPPLPAFAAPAAQTTCGQTVIHYPHGADYAGRGLLAWSAMPPESSTARQEPPEPAESDDFGVYRVIHLDENAESGHYIIPASGAEGIYSPDPAIRQTVFDPVTRLIDTSPVVAHGAAENTENHPKDAVLSVSPCEQIRIGAFCQSISPVTQTLRLSEPTATVFIHGNRAPAFTPPLNENVRCPTAPAAMAEPYRPPRGWKYPVGGALLLGALLVWYSRRSG